MTKNLKTALILLLIVVAMTLLPFAVARGAEFGGTDDAGSQMVNQIRGEEYQPWFTPPLESLFGGELPGEIESLLFCLQTGIGVGVLAFGFGYYTARKKYARQNPEH